LEENYAERLIGVLTHDSRGLAQNTIYDTLGALLIDPVSVDDRELVIQLNQAKMC